MLNMWKRHDVDDVACELDSSKTTLNFKNRTEANTLGFYYSVSLKVFYVQDTNLLSDFIGHQRDIAAHSVIFSV